VPRSASRALAHPTNPSRALRRFSESYDRIAFAAIEPHRYLTEEPRRGRAQRDRAKFLGRRLPPETSLATIKRSPQDGRRELIMGPVIIAVVTALIGAAGTVLAALVQTRARRQPRRERSRPGRGGRGRQDRNSGQAGARPR